jgi:Xaa-Pro aminopeptidase
MVQEKSYSFEYEIEADISHKFRSVGLIEAWSPVIASGRNACTFHYSAGSALIDNRELILADVGAECEHYASDLTRTWSPSKPSSRQMAVFKAVDEAVEFGIEQLKPGPSFYECEQRVREFIGQKLVELKLITRADDKDGIYRHYPHSPHYLGLDVHDVGSTKQPLEPGMVMTIEPGIYIPDEGIGIRLEEDILITEAGCKILSKACPRALTSVQ